MNKIKNRIIEEFGNKLRIRVCGLLIEDDKILLVNHHSLNENGDFWAPPGGGMNYSESAEESLKREFQEEVGIDVDVVRFAFVHEYLSPPLHAIELFFVVNRVEGEINIGFDPEMKMDEQIIKDVKFKSYSDLKEIHRGSMHQVFFNFKSLREVQNGHGYYLFKS